MSEYGWEGRARRRTFPTTMTVSLGALGPTKPASAKAAKRT